MDRALAGWGEVVYEREKSTMKRFLQACRGEAVDRTPVWFMRQAGRYMEEYRRIRRKHTLLEICRNPDLATEVTLQPIRRFQLDAAIIFADILLPLPGMGVAFEFVPGKGPVIERPVVSPERVAQVHVGEPEEELSFVYEALRTTRRALPEDAALIGFAGAPFTVASYMVEGGYSRHFACTKELMYRRPASWHDLMDKVSTATVRYLRAQIAAGAEAVQLFDSWVGALSAEDYFEYVFPYSHRIFQEIGELGVPSIHFGTGTAGFLKLMKRAGGDVQSVDWRIPLGEAWSRLGPDARLQGNLDPLLLTAPDELLRSRVEGILREAEGRAGHIFNLGHGILPQTSEDKVESVVRWVREFTLNP